MGMFDYLKINGMLITNLPSWVVDIFYNETFQTKSFYCYSENYEIRCDGIYREEEDDDGTWWVKIMKTVDVEFHTSVGNNWFSFEAKYKRGKLIRIDCPYYGPIKKIDIEDIVRSLGPMKYHDQEMWDKCFPDDK